MTDTYAPAARIVVVASLLLAIVTVMFATVNVSRAAGVVTAAECGVFCNSRG